MRTLKIAASAAAVLIAVGTQAFAGAYDYGYRPYVATYAVAAAPCATGNCPTGFCATPAVNAYRPVCKTGNCATGTCASGVCRTGTCATGKCATACPNGKCNVAHKYVPTQSTSPVYYPAARPATYVPARPVQTWNSPYYAR